MRIIKSYRLRACDGTIAFSEAVYRRIAKRVARVNGVFVSLRGEHAKVMAVIHAAAREMPGHFTDKSLELLGYGRERKAA